MKRPVVVAVAVVLLAVVAFVIWRSRRSEPAAGAGKQPAAVRKGIEGRAVTPVRPGGGGARVEQADDPAGALRLEGQVLDAEGVPVAGAQVGVAANPPRQVTTEGDGSFAVDGLLAREYTLEAHHGDHHAGPVTVRLTSTTEPVILRLRPAGVVEVTAVDAVTRAPIAGATVELRGTFHLQATTDAAGKAVLRTGAGWPILVVSAAGYAPARRFLETEGVPGAVARQTVELVHGAEISGRVLDPAGQPVAGARVLPEPAADPFPVVDARRDGVLTGADGVWRFAALPAGTFRFTAAHAVLGPGASPPIVLDGATARRDVDIRLEGGARVAGRVVDRAGAPVAGAAVRVALADGHMWQLTQQAYSDDTGRFDLPGLPRKPVHMVAIHEQASSALLAIDLAGKPETTGLTITLDLDGAIAGVVVSASGEPIPEALVLALPAETGRADARFEWRVRGTAQDVADAGGRFRLAGLPAGSYRIRAARAGASEEALFVGAGTPAKVGDVELRLVLPAEGVVKGRVLYADGSAPAVYSVAAGGASTGTLSNGDGTFSFAVLGGKQSLTVSGPAFATKLVADVAVAEAGETDVGTITVQRGRSIAGRVLGPDGAPIAGAKVAAGSLLTGDGVTLNIPSEGHGVKETETANDGRYLFEGLGEGILVVVAEHDPEGRAPSVAIAAGTGSVELDLVLEPTGAAEGKVTRAGAPLEKVIVLANPKQAPRSNFFVMTGPDGSYRFDKLAPGAYHISVMLGGGGGRPGDFHRRSAAIGSGRTVHLDLELAAGGVAVEIAVTTADAGAPVAAARVFMASGRVPAGRTMRDLRDQQGEMPDGSVHIGMAIGGQPARFQGIQPGTYSACGLAVPGDPNDRAAMQRFAEIAETLPLGCTTFEIAAAPAMQTIALVVPAVTQ